jgi:hypothetical protein
MKGKLGLWGVVGSLVIVIVAGSGCSSFQREWKKSPPSALASSTDTGLAIAGRWEGTWQSTHNGHNGALRCIVRPLSKDVYSARFHAKYRRLLNLRFGYTALLKVTTEPPRSTFRGEADLGWYAGGVYQYEGHVEGTNFTSTYSCKYDQGTFRMTRVP